MVHSHCHASHAHTAILTSSRITGACRIAAAPRWHDLQLHPALRHCSRPQRSSCIAATNSSSDNEDSTESLFQKELAKRGLDGASVKSDDRQPEGASSSRDESRLLPRFRLPEASASDQLARSRRLNSEGLEGLIPRVTELVKLGGSFWLSFWPVIGATIAAFVVVQLLNGGNFVHRGDQRMAIPDYLPAELYQEDPSSAASALADPSADAPDPTASGSGLSLNSDSP